MIRRDACGACVAPTYPALTGWASLCRTYGAWLLYAIAYPALTRWANLRRPLRGFGVVGRRFCSAVGAVDVGRVAWPVVSCFEFGCLGCRVLRSLAKGARVFEFRMMIRRDACGACVAPTYPALTGWASLCRTYGAWLLYGIAYPTLTRWANL